MTTNETKLGASTLTYTIEHWPVHTNVPGKGEGYWLTRVVIDDISGTTISMEKVALFNFDSDAVKFAPWLYRLRALAGAGGRISIGDQGLETRGSTASRKGPVSELSLNTPILDLNQIDCCQRIGRDEAARSNTIGLTELDALCETARAYHQAEARVLEMEAAIREHLAADDALCEIENGDPEQPIEERQAAHDRAERAYKALDPLVAKREDGRSTQKPTPEELAVSLPPMWGQRATGGLGARPGETTIYESPPRSQAHEPIDLNGVTAIVELNPPCHKCGAKTTLMYGSALPERCSSCGEPVERDWTRSES